MKVWLNSHGLYVWLLEPTPAREGAFGFVIKWRRRQHLLSERAKLYRRVWVFGPLLVRGYATQKRPRLTGEEWRGRDVGPGAGG